MLVCKLRLDCYVKDALLVLFVKLEGEKSSPLQHSCTLVHHNCTLEITWNKRSSHAQMLLLCPSGFFFKRASRFFVSTGLGSPVPLRRLASTGRPKFAYPASPRDRCFGASSLRGVLLRRGWAFQFSSFRRFHSALRAETACSLFEAQARKISNRYS